MTFFIEILHNILSYVFRVSERSISKIFLKMHEALIEAFVDFLLRWAHKAVCYTMFAQPCWSVYNRWSYKRYRQCSVTKRRGAFTKPLLQWKILSDTYLCVCVYALARVRECVRGCAWVGRCTGAGVCLRACSVTYPVCHAQAPYCLRPLWIHHIFRHYLINGMIFGKMSLNIKFQFLYSFCLKHVPFWGEISEILS